MQFKISRRFVCVALSVVIFPLLACLNEYGQKNTSGKPSEYMHEGLPVFSRGFDRIESEKFVADHDLSRVASTDFETRSDVAFHYCRLGRYDEALVIFRKLYQEFPNTYNIAANLGTTYELVGKPDSALQVLKISMKLDPESHYGSEWVHLRVLEAKLHLQKNPDWLKTNQVLGMGIKKSTVEYDSLAMANQDKIMDVIYQLEERIPFTPTPSTLMANVLNEVADAIAMEHSITEGYILYHIALQYDLSDPYNVKKKMEDMKPLFDKYDVSIPNQDLLNQYFPQVATAEISSAPNWYLWIGGIVFVAAICLVFVMRR